MKSTRLYLLLILISLFAFSCKEEDPDAPTPVPVGNETLVFRVYYGQYAANAPTAYLNTSQTDFIDSIYTHTLVGDNNGIIEFDNLVPDKYYYKIVYNLGGNENVAKGIIEVNEGIPAQESIYF